MRNQDICIVGSGFVGLTIGLAFALKNHKVTFVDSNSEIIRNLRLGVTHLSEPGIEEQIADLQKKQIIRFETNSTFSMLNETFTTFIIAVGTPITNGSIDNSSIRHAAELIAPKVNSSNLVIVRSTVPIGISRNVVFDLLKRTTPNFLFATCPERTAEGVAMDEISKLPQIIGGIDRDSSQAAFELFKTICNEVVILDSPEAAEIAKLASNVYRDLIFGFSNDLARLTGKMGINIGEIINACNYNYPRANIPFPGPAGGPCLSKDSWILYESAKNFDVELFTPRAARNSNENVTLFFAEEIVEKLNTLCTKKICLLGLSFKGEPPIADYRGSAAQEIIPYLRIKFPTASIWGHESSGHLDIKDIHQTSELTEALANADLVFILTNSNDYIQIEELLSLKLAKNSILVDLWGLIKSELIRKDIKIYKWGCNER